VSRLTKARTSVLVPGTPGVPSRPAEVQCPPPPPGRAYVVRNGTYVLAAITPAAPPPVTTMRPGHSCHIETINGVRYLVCRNPFPSITPLGGGG